MARRRRSARAAPAVPTAGARSGLPAVLLVASLLAAGAALLTGRSRALLTTDDADYLMMVTAVARDGTLDVRNGYDVVASPELVIGNLRVWPTPEGPRLRSQYPPLYAWMALPAWRAGGASGLFVLSTLAFLATVALVYAIASRLGGDGEGLAAAAGYGLLTFASTHAILLWPHALSAALSTLSVACLLASQRYPRATALAAGCAAGLAFGVRYANVTLAAVSIAYLLVFERRRALPWAAGFVPPLAAILLLNRAAFGSALVTGYGPVLRAAGPAVPVGLAVAAASLALAVAVRRAPGLAERLRARASSRAGVAVLCVAIVVGVVTLAAYPPARLAVQIASAELLDLRLFPPMGEPPSLLKKGLLESCPFLVLALFWPALDRRRELGLLCALGLAQVAFYSLRRHHGGTEDAYHVRYLLEVLPFATVLAVRAASSMLRPLRPRQWLALGVVLSASTLAIGPLLWNGSRWYPRPWAYTALPLALAALLAVLAAAVLVRPRALARLALGGVLAVACAQSLIESVGDLACADLSLRGSADLARYVGASVPPGAVLVYVGKLEVAHYGLLKAERDLILVDVRADRGRSLLAVLSHWVGRAPIVLVDTGQPGWFQAGETVRRTLPAGTVSWVRARQEPAAQ